jgi:TetR/AcrR family tetracycline transcriptional repressor
VNSKERVALDRREVVRVALGLLDELGLEGLTMRALAERLGVKAASLYWHLRDKDQLIDLLVEAINTEVRVPDSRLPWRQRLEQQAGDWRRVLLKHRDAARLTMGRFVTGPVTLRLVDAALGAVREAGFSDREAAKAAYLISNYVPGFVAEETSRSPVPTARQLESSPAGAPGDSPRMRLELSSDARLTIESDPSLNELFSVRCEGRPPDVRLSEGILHVHRGRGRRHECTLVLSATASWTVAVPHGASHVTADMRRLRLEGFELKRGASFLDLVLPVPEDAVPIRIEGGASQVLLHRPPGVPIRAQLKGGVSRFELDGERFKAGRELHMQTPDYEQAMGRYDIVVTGGISKVIVDTQLPKEEAPRIEPAPAGGRGPLEGLSASEYPNLMALGHVLAEPSMDERFDFGLKVLLDGLEDRLAQS